MTFLGADDILLLDKDNGKVYRIKNGIESGPLLDVNVASDGYRGLLGVTASNKEIEPTKIFLYFTEAHRHDGIFVLNLDFIIAIKSTIKLCYHSDYSSVNNLLFENLNSLLAL